MTNKNMNKQKKERLERKKKDKIWAKMIKEKYHNKCIICGEEKYLNAHHIIPKEIKKFRHDTINGIALCPKHHRFSFELSAHQNPVMFWRYIKKNHAQIIEEIESFLKDEEFKLK